MLFEKIRRTQKPVFIFLALTFGLGFVLLGVGSGAGGVNPLEFLGDDSPTGSIGDLNEKVKDDPADADAWLDLARAYAADGQLDPALGAYASYLDLRPDDVDITVTAASLYEQRARNTAAEGSVYQLQLNALQAQQSATAASDLKLVTAFDDPLLVQLQQPLQAKATEYQSRVQGDLQQAIGLWQEAVKLEPANTTYWRALANDALSAQDYRTAVRALKKVVALEPDSPDRKQLESTIKQLEGLSGAVTPSG